MNNQKQISEMKKSSMNKAQENENNYRTHTVIKLSNTSDGKIWKAARGKRDSTCKDTEIRLTNDFSQETMQTRIQ